MSNRAASVTDSPWFWAHCFCVAAWGLTVLWQTRIGDRQLQIERNAAGRQRAVAPVEQQALLDVPEGEQKLIAFDALGIVLMAAALVTGVMFWRGLLFRARRRGGLQLYPGRDRREDLNHEGPPNVGV